MNEGRGLRFLYGTRVGRAALRVMVSPFVSKLGGAALSTRASRALVSRFVRKNGIDMSDYLERPYKSFNDFFTRELRPGAREIDMEPCALIAPCDGRLSVYSVTEGRRLRIKSCDYALDELLGGNAALARRFEGGLALIFRLCVDDYHRYCFFDGGRMKDGAAIAGVLHTVRPVALARARVFAQNAREYRVLDTDNFGDAVQVEVGAMMVGKIRNLPVSGRFERGQEKGMFEFGGSTVALFLQRGKAGLRPDLQSALDSDAETRVRLGERIGVRKQSDD